MQNSLQRQNNFKLNSRWLLAGLLFLVGVALFPYGLIPFDRIFSFFPDFGRTFDQISSSWQAHVVGHATIFTVIGTAVLLCFPNLFTRPKLYFGMMMLLGILQEFFQIVGFKHRGIVFDDMFDVFVDLGGALIAFLLVYFFLKIFSTKSANEVDS